MRAERHTRAVLLAVLPWLGCTPALAPAAEPPAIAALRGAAQAGPEAIDYRFALDAALSTLDAEVCFRGAPPPELVAGIRDGAEQLSLAWVERAAARQALPVHAGRIQLGGLPRDGCLHYRIDLGSAGDRFGVDAVRRGDALVTNTALWLWRPARWDDLRELTASFSMPKGMRVLLAWPRDADGEHERYTLDHSAFAFYGFAVFGRFEIERIEVASAVLEVAVLEGFDARKRAQVVPWLSAQARMAALPLGRFPSERSVIAVVPTVSSPGDPVRFGMAARGGGASLLLRVSPDAELDALLRDWVAVHEFCHLMHPFVTRDDAWLSEGLATYYQEIARVRGGVLDEVEAWRRIFEGAELGRGTDRNLAQESARMSAERSFSRVYWAGAAFALLADVELRRRTQGKVSLDLVMRELSRCCARAPRPVPARELIAEMDRIAGTPVFSELMQRWVLGPRLPQLSELYVRLGVTLGPDGVRIAEHAEEGWIRAAIMATSAPARGETASAAQR